VRTDDIIRRAGQSLRQAKARTLLTSLAIAVGAFTLTLALAAGEGSRQYADKIINSNIDPQMLYVLKDKSLIGEGDGAMSLGGTGLMEYSETATQYGGLTIETLSADDLAKIERHPSIKKVTPTYLVKAQYVTFSAQPEKKYTTDITVFDTSVQPEVAAGTLPGGDRQLADDEVVVPEAYLQKLGADPASFIGSTVTLHLVRPGAVLSEAEMSQIVATEGMAALQDAMKVESKEVTLKVRAVSKQSVTSLSASSGLFIAENTARAESDFLTEGTEQYRSYIAVMASVKDGVDPATVKADLEKDAIYSMTAKDLQGLLFTIVNLIQGIVIGFGILALIASVFGIINTQYISVLERTQQIGLMKALGARGTDVARLFRYEAAWIGFLGGVIGSALAWGVGTLLNPFITETIGLGEGNALLVFQIVPIIALIALLVAVGIAAGFFPARKAAKLDPIEALRTE
jgi:putative ABC transport system permease protein